MPRLVVLLSGGLDSATVAAWALAQAYEVHALAVDYGQRHRHELEAARAVAERLGLASFRVLRVDLAELGGSALTAPLPVPKDRSLSEIGTGIPSTYVPARNTVLLGLALAAAEVLDAQAVAIGVNALDCSGYPDCRPEFLEAFRRVALSGTRRGVQGQPLAILAPLIADSKADIVRRGAALRVPWELTLSCYDPVPEPGLAPEADLGTQRRDRPDVGCLEAPPRVRPCGRCDACLLRAKGFAEAGVRDPAVDPV